MPLVAASVSTLVVSWKLAAEMNESVLSEALVIPSSTGWPLAAFLPSAVRRLFSFMKRKRSTTSSIRKALSPTSSTFTQRIIWREITSMCLSLMLTPCRR